jgi:hypothetical protein
MIWSHVESGKFVGIGIFGRQRYVSVVSMLLEVLADYSSAFALCANDTTADTTHALGELSGLGRLSDSSEL